MNATPTQAVPTRAGGVTQRLAALALALWLGGIGCLVGCGTAVFAAPAGEPHVISASQDTGATESCPLSAGHDCCRRAKSVRDGTASLETLPQSIPTMGCCPLAGQSADPVRKTRLTDAPPEVAGSKLLPTSHTGTYIIAEPPGRRRVPDRGGTYLRCCVFLI
jgi:hypothetical protein